MNNLRVVACLWIAILGILQAPHEKGAARDRAAGVTSQTSAAAATQRNSASAPDQKVAAPSQRIESPIDRAKAERSLDDIEIQRQLAKYTRALVWVGVVQAVVLGGTLLLIWRQAKLMKTHADHLANVASSASLNAQALINAERPWVMIQIVGTPVPGSARASFEISAFNYGKGPAHVVSCSGPKIDFCRIPERDLKVPPDYGAWEWERRFVAPKDSFLVGVVDPWADTVQAIRAAMASDQNVSREGLILVAYGLIEYTDGVSDRTYKTAFCYRLHRNLLSQMGGHLVPCGPREYNLYA